MQIIQSKTISFSLVTLVISIEVIKIKTSFLKIWCNCSNNSVFYCIYSA